MEKKMLKKERREKRKERIKRVKEELKEKFRLNAPNAITLARLVLAFVVVYMIFLGITRLTVAIVFAIAALTDMLDGYVARKFNQTSKIGGRLDQVIDRIFTVIIVVSLIVWALQIKAIEKNFITMLFLISSREIIGIFGIIIRAIRGRDLYDVRFIGKLTCWFQGFALAFVIAGFSFAIYFAIATCLIGIVSGFDYLKKSFI